MNQSLMKYHTLCRLALLLLLAVPTLAQEFVTVQNASLLLDSATSLNSNRQETLAVAVRGQAVNGVVPLLPNTVVTVVNQASFVQKETLHLAGSPMPKDVKRQFKAALVEVKSGPNQGKKGWTVISYQDPGQKPVLFLTNAPAGASTNGPAAAPSAEAGVDLSVSVNSGSNSPTGGRLYNVSIVNRGTVELKGSFDVVLELDGKPFKTERVKGPLKAGQGASFTVTIGDKDLRKNATLKATADPRNLLKESQTGNNTASTVVSP